MVGFRVGCGVVFRLWEYTATIRALALCRGGRCIICIATRRAGFHLDSCNFLSRCWTSYTISPQRIFYQCVRSSRTLGMESGGWRLFLRLLAANTFSVDRGLYGKEVVASGKNNQYPFQLYQYLFPSASPKKRSPQVYFPRALLFFSFLYKPLRVVHENLLF